MIVVKYAQLPDGNPARYADNFQLTVGNSQMGGH
jgi:hypothetical protein